MKKTILLPVAVLALAAMLSYGVGQAKAEGSNSGHHPLVEFIAERFGLDADEVQEAALEYREEHHEEMFASFEERLGAAVVDGNISDEQQEAILQKYEEMRAEREEFLELEPEERRDAIMDHHEGLREWAEENEIDLSVFKFGEMKGRHGFGIHGGIRGGR